MPTVPFKYSNIYYYISSYSRYYLKPLYWNWKLVKLKKKASKYDVVYLKNRVDYYNKLTKNVSLGDKSVQLKDFTFIANRKTYYLDAFKYTQLFPLKESIAFVFEDLTTIPEVPSLVKSRPIGGANKNAVILKLNRIRHFVFVNDKLALSKKKNTLIWRGNVWKWQPNRVQFLEQYFHNNMCDIACVNDSGINADWRKDKLGKKDQLEYKFILSLEGNDVATNLKWIMSSNSLAVMPKPKYETWFMEGTLIPDYHYVCIKDDFSDLEDKLQYFISNPDKAEDIRKNANEFVNQFKNNTREDVISTMVLEKYFKHTDT